MAELTKETEIAVKAVLAASRICIKVQADLVLYRSQKKSDKSPVTVADYASQAVICRELREHFPGEPVVAEEHSSGLISGDNEMVEQIVGLVGDIFPGEVSLANISRWIDCDHKRGPSRKWVLDPIDGTKGFLRGGQYAIALALIENGEILFGALGCPNIDYEDGKKGCIFVAEKRRGARVIWIEDISVSRSIHVSADKDPGELKFVESFESAHTDHAAHDRLYGRLGVSAPHTRIDGQAKYALVARGDVSAYLRMQSPLTPDYRQMIWDHAAGCVIVEEAGGKVTDITGKPLDFSFDRSLENNIGIIATNGLCHDRILDQLRHCEEPKATKQSQ
ncbi:MAG: 3'(2'),5'-bisphosphate nucleotidase [Candidatus Omnitrophica bacterium]|nr:3'(2'),5'-bisphosphate nucleotidase [Candidatus Omnitrophota bacterium]